MQEYFLKVEAYNDKYYKELDFLRRIQYEIRIANQCIKHESKPKRVQDIMTLPQDGENKIKNKGITKVSQAQIDAYAELGYTLINPLNN